MGILVNGTINSPMWDCVWRTIRNFAIGILTCPSGRKVLFTVSYKIMMEVVDILGKLFLQFVNARRGLLL